MDILTDLSTPALTKAIRENLFEFCKAASHLPQGEHYEDESFARWYFEVPYPWFNGMLAKRGGTNSDKSLIEETIRYFRSKYMGPFVWWLAPGVQRADWESILHPFKFQFSDDTPGLAVELAALNKDVRAPQNFTIMPVKDEKTLQRWVRVFIEGYGLPSIFYDSVHKLLLNFGFDGLNQNYLGFLDGKQVATSNVFFGAGVAGIQMVATLPEARGKGIGAAMTLQPLLDAQKMGYRAGVLQSSEMGFPVYQRLGFMHLCQMEYFYLE